MPRKIQRKPIRQIRKEVIDRPSTVNSFNIQGAIAVLGGVTGVIVAILWIAGRIYAASYFGVMNIPSFQINFSVWEYAEFSWLRLAFYFLRKIYPVVMLLAIIPLTILFASLLLQRIFPRLKILNAINNIVSAIKRLRSGISYVSAFTIIIIFSYLLLESFIDINKSGQIDGKDIVFSGSYAVQVYSKDYLPLGPPKVISKTAPTIMEYSGLRLLIFNNGKYYLFRDIDPITCKPSQVFVISDSPNIILTLSTIAPIDSPCATTMP